MRLPRFKTPDRVTYYHLRARICGQRGWFPLQQEFVARQIIQFLDRFLKLYFCELVCWVIMGNHIHLILRFQPYRRLSQRELERRAREYYQLPVHRPQTNSDWRRFNRRLFDVSEFMRNLDGAIARWFNDTFGRRGALFAGRFQSSILETEKDVINCMLYIDLNPVRANLVDRPEDWRWGSVRQRLNGEDGGLVCLSELMLGRKVEECRAEYRLRLYWRGAIGGTEGRRRIPNRLIEEELKRGTQYGQDLQRQRWMTAGAVIGSYSIVAEWLNRLHNSMTYQRRCYPIKQLGGSCFSLRPQRKRRWDLAYAAVDPG